MDGWDGIDGMDGMDAMDGLMDGWIISLGYRFCLYSYKNSSSFFFESRFVNFHQFFSILLILLGTHLNNYLQNGLVRTLASRLPLG